METVRYEDGKVIMVDQTKLPTKLEYIELETYEEVAESIKNLKVRGAPAIGVSAAFGLLLASRKGNFNILKKAAEDLKETRPTAVNLFWAIEEVMSAARQADDWQDAVEKKAKNIFTEDRNTNYKLSEVGSKILGNGDSVLTHCNAGSLATSGGYGTALGVIKRAVEKGKELHVYCTETRPVMQGARLTSFELVEDIEVDATLIVDSAVGTIMEELDKVIVGADRVVSDGVANKIGTYNIAVLANKHNVDFYVAAPKSTFDMDLNTNEIEIEERSEDEVKKIKNQRIAPEDIKAYNPAFDITPSSLIKGIITEDEIVEL